MRNINLNSFGAFVELTDDELLEIDGGGVMDAIKDVGRSVGRAVGYASGAIKDFVTSGDWRANEALMLAI